MTRPKVIAVDMDGVLCRGEAWTPQECLEAEPCEKTIQIVNSLSMENFIIIWTARRDSLIPATLHWLRMQGVRFEAISNNKMVADVYVDNKMKSLEELREEQ